jgi:23S rRNA pseudouridine1911/1915/1917 synthase
MEERLRLSIPDHLAGERADKVVAELAGISRQAGRRLFELGVTVDGALVDPNRRLTTGVIEFAAPAGEEILKAEDVEFVVVHEDQHVLVIDKPAGLVVHPGAGRSRGTLAGGLLFRYPDLQGVGEAGRWGIVHRLDQGTSGLLLVARNPPAHQRLVADLRDHLVHRSYLALVHGVPDMPTGTIDAPIGRDPAHPTRKKVIAGGRPSRTHYRVQRDYQVASLLDVDLETGRTHQIRVHLAAIDHPVVGDRTYSRRKDPVPMRRMFLHAHRIRFVHPETGKEINIESALPQELAAVMVELERVYPGRAVST